MPVASSNKNTKLQAFVSRKKFRRYAAQYKQTMYSTTRIPKLRFCFQLHRSCILAENNDNATNKSRVTAAQ